MRYLLDTNILVDAARAYYRFSFGTRYWDWLLAANTQGNVGSIQQVRAEIHELNPDFRRWLQTAVNQGFFMAPLPEWMPHYTAVMSYVTNSYQPGKDRDDFANGADGWLIAAAIVSGGAILTFEKPAPASPTKPKIPTVAQHFSVQCVDPWQAYEDLNARF